MVWQKILTGEFGVGGLWETNFFWRDICIDVQQSHADTVDAWIYAPR